MDNQGGEKHARTGSETTVDVSYQNKTGNTNMHKYELQNVSERWIAGSFMQSFKEVFYRWRDGLLTKLQCRRKMQIFFKLVQQGQRNQRKGAVFTFKR